MNDNIIYELWQDTPNISTFDFGLKVARLIDAHEDTCIELEEALIDAIYSFRGRDIRIRDVVGILEGIKFGLIDIEGEDE